MYCSSWVLGYLITRYLFADSPAVNAYSLIMAWWLTCYLGYVLEIRTRDILYACLLYTMTLILDFALGTSWFYHDPPSQFNLFSVILVIANSFIFISPAFVNSAMRYLKSRWK